MVSSKTWPDKIDAYTLKEIIGRGGQGEVYKSICIPNNATCAIKKTSLKDKISKVRVENEMKILNKIKHELVIQMFTSFNDDSSFLIMELMYGSFVQVIRERKLRKFSDVTLATILWPVVNAIAYLHSIDIVHQDLKPGNILLGFDGSIKICDFGVAAFVDPDTKYVVEGSRIGTVPYIAPEICKWKNYNSKADVWSIGIITLELGLLTMSKYNFHVNNIPHLIREAMITGTHRYKPSYREFVESCLKIDPDDRVKSTDLLQASLMNLALDQTHLMVELLGYKA